MINPYFIIFEIVTYSLSMLCFLHALKNGAGNIVRLIAGILFGVLLELATIRQLHAYTYGQFPTMILDVPLCIGVSWGSILYSAMEFSDASSLPWPARPFLDGLLALNIDLAMDAIAIRLGMWDWGQGFDFHFFGVPYANFWAWFWVISSFSFGYRLLAHKNGWLKTWVAPVSGLGIGLFWVLATNWFISFQIPFDRHWLAALGIIIGALSILVALRPTLNQRPAPGLVFWVPFVSHLYFLIAGAVSGAIFDSPIILAVSLVMFSVALWLHYPMIITISRNILSKPGS